MSDDREFGLQDLAQAFGLTERSARHYVGSLLPPRLRPGRGKRARFGRDCWNCFAFIRKATDLKFTHEQIAGMLATFSQRQVDNVARGLDQLAIVPLPAEEPAEAYSSPCMLSEFPGPPPGGPLPRWQMLFADDELQIAHRGSAAPAQREQVRLTAALLKRILRG